MHSPQRIGDEEEVQDKFIINWFRIRIQIRKIHKNMNSFQEVEEEVQVNLEEEAKKDLM